MNYKDVNSFIIYWQNKFPIDRWWREKHNIAFGSKAHRESCFIDQLFEYEEDVLFNEFKSNNKGIQENGNWLKPHELSEKDWLEESRENLKKYYDNG